MPASSRPPPILPGQTTIGVIAPGSPPSDLSTLEEGLARLRGMGIRIKSMRSFEGSPSYLCGTDIDRAAEINRFFADDAVEGMMCVRGGYGALRILPLIDYQTARRNPKLIVGYSDVTALQLALFARAGIPSISGPMIGVDWASIEQPYERQFWNLAAGLLEPLGDHLVRIRDGEVDGILLGGNLSVLTRLIGTSYLPSLKGAILFLEDVNEPPYRVDAMLAHLKLAGLWDQLGGLVLGQFTGPDALENTSPDIAAVFDDYCRDAPFPVASNLLYGHIPAKWALPQGVRARLVVNAAETSLTILEPVVQTRPISTKDTLSS